MSSPRLPMGGKKRGAPKQAITAKNAVESRGNAALFLLGLTAEKQRMSALLARAQENLDGRTSTAVTQKISRGHILLCGGGLGCEIAMYAPQLTRLLELHEHLDEELHHVAGIAQKIRAAWDLPRLLSPIGDRLQYLDAFLPRSLDLGPARQELQFCFEFFVNLWERILFRTRMKSANAKPLALATMSCFACKWSDIPPPEPSEMAALATYYAVDAAGVASEGYWRKTILPAAKAIAAELSPGSQAPPSWLIAYVLDRLGDPLGAELGYFDKCKLSKASPFEIDHAGFYARLAHNRVERAVEFVARIAKARDRRPRGNSNGSDVQ